MTTRRDVLQLSAEALAGLAFVGGENLIPSTPGVRDRNQVAMLGGNAMKLLGIKA